MRVASRGVLALACARVRLCEGDDGAEESERSLTVRSPPLLLPPHPGAGRATRFWEGGEGCRDTRFMNRNDPHKWRGKVRMWSGAHTGKGGCHA